MTVKQTDTIDFITTSEDGSSVSLTMVEDRPLATPGLLDETVAKMNSYFAFMASGHLEEVEPRAVGADLRVEYNVLDDPDSCAELSRILRDAAALFTRNGVEFVVRHFDVLPKDEVTE